MCPAERWAAAQALPQPYLRLVVRMDNFTGLWVLSPWLSVCGGAFMGTAGCLTSCLWSPGLYDHCSVMWCPVAHVTSLLRVTCCTKSLGCHSPAHRGLPIPSPKASDIPLFPSPSLFFLSFYLPLTHSLSPSVCFSIYLSISDYSIKGRQEFSHKLKLPC